MARKANIRGKLKSSGSGPILGQKMAIQVEGTGQDGGYNIPRYRADGFKMSFSPYPDGMIKAHIGAELCGDDGIIYYPENADVDPKRAAEAQALSDYNHAVGKSPKHKREMVAIYGCLYTDEFERLAKLKVGNSGPSPWRK